MFVTRSFPVMRLVALFSITALIALVTAFDYEAADLPFVNSSDSDASADAAMSSESTPTERSPADLDAIAVPGLLQLESIGTFEAPIEAFSRVGDPRTFVVQQVGQVIAADPTQTLILDVSANILSGPEQGLLGAAFDPFDPLLYVHYIDLAGNTVVAEYSIDPATAVADPTSFRQVLAVEQPYENHNGGELVFGPDGFLYLGLGDGGLADDPIRSALDLSSSLGKILRFDPTASATGSYTVPMDNPFIDTPGAQATIWSYGLRNPWKFSFDAATGDLWIADVGQNEWEEVNAAPAVDGTGAGRGLSFGWSAFEGDARFNDDQSADGHTAPVVTYERADGQCSISGGAVYRGQALPHLDGWFVYGDYCTGTIWGFDTEAAPEAREIIQLAQDQALAAIATGGDGELYAVSIVGTVSRLS